MQQLMATTAALLLPTLATAAVVVAFAVAFAVAFTLALGHEPTIVQQAVLKEL